MSKYFLSYSLDARVKYTVLSICHVQPKTIVNASMRGSSYANTLVTLSLKARIEQVGRKPEG